MFKNILLGFSLFIIFVIVGVIYSLIVAPESSFPEPESTFQGPGPNTPMGVKGPDGPPPGN